MHVRGPHPARRRPGDHGASMSVRPTRRDRRRRDVHQRPPARARASSSCGETERRGEDQGSRTTAAAKNCGALRVFARPPRCLGGRHDPRSHGGAVDPGPSVLLAAPKRQRAPPWGQGEAWHERGGCCRGSRRTPPPDAARPPARPPARSLASLSVAAPPARPSLSLSLSVVPPGRRLAHPRTQTNTNMSQITKQPPRQKPTKTPN